MTSILTNNGAIVALQTLKNTNKMLGMTQREISTGKRINTAADGSAIWAVAKTMETDRDSFKTIQQGLNVAAKVTSTAAEFASGIVDDLKEIKQRLVASQNDDQDAVKNSDEVKELIAGIKEKIDSAQINGVNLLNKDGAGAGTDKTSYTVVASSNRTYGEAQTATTTITVESADLATKIYDKIKDWALTSSDDAKTYLGNVIDGTSGGATGGATGTDTIDTLIDTAIKEAAKLGAKQHRIEAQEESVGKIADNLTAGIGALVDTNLEEASARLQTQQQLGIQSLSIANQAPGAVLALFR